MNDRRLNTLFTLLQAYIILFCVCSGESLIIGAESEDHLLNFVSKLSYSASVFNLIDCLAYGAVVALICFVKKSVPQVDWYGVVVGLLLGSSYILSFAFRDYGSISVMTANAYQCFLTVVLLWGYTSLIYLCFELIRCSLERVLIRNAPAKTWNRRVFVISSCTVFIGWILWPILNYPGSVAGDAITQLNMFFLYPMTAHHPPLSSWIMGACVQLGGFLINRDFGIFLYLFLQSVIAALIIGYSVNCMASWGCSIRLCTASVILLAFTPILSLFTQYFEKDMLYTLFMLLFSCIVAQVIISGQLNLRTAIFLFFVSLLACLLRHNGIYAIMPVFFVFILYLKEKDRIRSLVLFTLTPVIYLTITSGIYPALGIEKGLVREALSIPMQQSARYLRDHGDEVTEEEREVLEDFFINYDEAPLRYDPISSDPVKDNVTADFNEPLRYFGTWFLMGLKHPMVYIDAFGCLNYGYMAPAGQNTEPDLMTREEVLVQLHAIGVNGTQDTTRSAILESIVRINTMYPLLRYLTMPGTYVWFTVIVFALIFRRKRWKELILIIPNLMNILVCLASPLSNALRYELPIVLSVPLMIAWTQYAYRKE